MSTCSDADSGRMVAFWLMVSYACLTVVAAIVMILHVYGSRVVEVLKGFEKRGSEVAQAASQGVQNAAQGFQHDIQKIKNFGQRLTQTSNGGPTAESNNWEIDWSELIIEEEIGHGNMGCVYRGEWRGTVVAIKTVLPQLCSDEEMINRFKKEIDVFNTLYHPNILMFVGAVMKKEHVCLVTEFCEHGDLKSILYGKEQKFSWRVKLTFAIDTARGMLYLHDKASIIQRDLKSENLLVGEYYHIKIADFGLSRHLAPPGEMGTFCGTPSHVAPEIVKMQGYSSKADVFSFGIILWEFAMERRPYKDLRGMACAWEVANGRRPELPKEGDCPQGLVDIMTACWQQEPDERPTFKEVMAQLHKLMQVEKKMALHQQELAKQCNILSKAEMFDGMPESMVDHIVERMELVHYREGETICRQGDTGDAMYIIMDGKVDIYIRKMKTIVIEDDDEDDEKKANEEKTAGEERGDGKRKNDGGEGGGDEARASAAAAATAVAGVAATAAATGHDGEKEESKKKTKRPKRSKRGKDFGKKVREMQGIDFFGELALTSSENIRTATALCSTRVTVLKLGRADFLLASESGHSKWIVERRQFYERANQEEKEDGGVEENKKSD